MELAIEWLASVDDTPETVPVKLVFFLLLNTGSMDDNLLGTEELEPINADREVVKSSTIPVVTISAPWSVLVASEAPPVENVEV